MTLRTLMTALLVGTLSATATGQSADNYRGLLRDKTVTVERTNLPLVYISVGGRTILRDNYVLGRMKIIHNGEGQLNYGDTVNHPGQKIDYEGYIALKYRGNTSFDSSDKKPFAFRTLESNVLPDYGGKKQKVQILGMPKDNKWGFIAPWCDQTMFRDILSFELGRPWFDWTPRARLCEVFLDGTYYGVYALCERVSKGKGRLDLNDPGEDDGDLTGDYHVSVDHGYDPYFASSVRPWQSLDGSRVANNYIIKYEYEDPEDDEFAELPNGSRARSALRQEISKMEQSFLGDDWLDVETGYQRYIDRQSFIDYMLATELSLNIDGYRLSTHLYKHSETRGQKEGIDPRWKLTLWDYNIAWGNANYYGGDRTDLWQYMFNMNNPGDNCPIPFYWYRLLQDDDYVAALKARWQQYRQSNHSDQRLLATIDSLANTLRAEGAVGRNERAWGILERRNVWPVPYYATSYDDAVNHLKQWAKTRLHFMDRHLMPPRQVKSQPVVVAEGWNADIVAERTPAWNATTDAIDGADRVFYAASVQNAGGLPMNRQLTSAVDHVSYTLSNYNGNNALTLKQAGATGTLRFASAIETSELFFLATSGNGASALSIHLNYADGTTENTGTWDVRDWSVRRENLQGDEAVTGLGCIGRGTDALASDPHYCLFEFSVPVDSERLLESVTIVSTNWAYASVVGLSRVIDDDDVDAINAVETPRTSEGSGAPSVYSLGGVRQTGSHRGLNIIRYPDGRVKKVLRK